MQTIVHLRQEIPSTTQYRCHMVTLSTILNTVSQWHAWYTDHELTKISQTHENRVFIVTNSLAPGKSGCVLKQKSILNLVSLMGIWRTSYVNTLRWMPRDLTDGKSTLVQVMAWCHQATSHYLSQSWPRSMLLNGVTRPQWVNLEKIHLVIMGF